MAFDEAVAARIRKAYEFVPNVIEKKCLAALPGW